MHNAIGAHVYAGGFTSGVSKHFNVLAHLEHSGYGAEVVNLNFPGLPIYAGGPPTWPTSWPRGKDRPRWLYANPPCAIWSGAAAGRTTAWQDDPRLQMHHDIFEYATETIGVDVVAIESVPPSLTKGREHVDGLIAKAAERGYSSTIVSHDARYLGVAQRRPRIFYVFHKLTVDWMMPDFSVPMTVRQALKGVKKGVGYDTTLNAKAVELALQCGPGERLAKVFDRNNPDPARNARGQISGRPSFLEARVPLDRPSHVVIAGKMIHHTELRFMSQNELAAICSFPPDYQWPKGDFQTISGYMSRGVMPKVGEWLAENVARAIERNKRINQPRQELLDITGPPGRLTELPPANAVTYHHSGGEQDVKKPSTQSPPKPSALPDNVAGEGSGLYMRRLLHAGFGADEILAAVHRQFPGSKATKSDVSYNKNKLAKEGPPPPVGGSAKIQGAPISVPVRGLVKLPSQPDLPWEPVAKVVKSVVKEAASITQRAPSEGVPTALANALKSAGYRIDYARAGGDHVTLALTFMG